MNHRSKNYLLATFLLATVMVAIFAWQNYQQNQKLAAENERLKKLAVKPGTSATRSNRVEPPPQSVDALVNDLAPLDSTPTANERRQRALMGLSTLLNSPAVTNLIANQVGAAVDRNYADLFQALNLAPDQADALRNLLVQRQSVIRDVVAASAAQGSANGQDIQQQVGAAQAQVDTQIQALLGDTGYQTYQNYNSTLRQNRRTRAVGPGN